MELTKKANETQMQACPWAAFFSLTPSPSGLVSVVETTCINNYCYSRLIPAPFKGIGAIYMRVLLEFNISKYYFKFTV